MSFTCDPANTDALLRAMEEEVALVQEEGNVTEAEVEAVRQIACVRHRSALESNGSWMFWILDAAKAVELEGRQHQHQDGVVGGGGEGTGL